MNIVNTIEVNLKKNKLIEDDPVKVSEYLNDRIISKFAEGGYANIFVTKKRESDKCYVIKPFYQVDMDVFYKYYLFHKLLAYGLTQSFMKFHKIIILSTDEHYDLLEKTGFYNNTVSINLRKKIVKPVVLLQMELLYDDMSNNFTQEF
jgi:hypothetical protein